jgi:hypothetical protein
MEVVDNFLPRFYQETIYKSILLEQTPWTIIDEISGASSDVDIDGIKVLKKQTGFYHMCFGDDQVYSNLFYTIRPILDAIEHYCNKPIESLIRVRVGMFTKSSESGTNSPHVDFSDEHKSFLYYVNNSDGDTVFYNENYKNIKDGSGFSVKQKVSPVMGKAVLFDGLQYHSSSPPVLNDRRVVININYL